MTLVEPPPAVLWFARGYVLPYYGFNGDYTASADDGMWNVERPDSARASLRYGPLCVSVGRWASILFKGVQVMQAAMGRMQVSPLSRKYQSR